MYDAIVVLGGSFIDQYTLPEWVISRLDYAISQNSRCKYFILSSRGTPHKAPPIDKTTKHPVDECQIMANYMMNKGITHQKILLESWSRDTIGNAYALLTHHCIPSNLRKIHIVTSDFHMPRSKAIFNKVFSLFPLDVFELSYYLTESTLPISNKEQESLEKWREKSKDIHTLMDLHKFMYLEHKAYTCNTDNSSKQKEFKQQDMRMYCI